MKNSKTELSIKRRETIRPDWSSCWTRIGSVQESAHPHEVFELLARNPDWPFVPVVNEQGFPIGVVRERRLKGYAYARFGRELIQRQSLREFIDPAAVVSCDLPLEELLMSGSNNPNPEGLLLVEHGVYRAVLLNAALLRLHEEHHVQTQVRLANAEKMEAIGTLAGGIAHDLNNILTPILGYSNLIRDAAETGEPVSVEMVDQIIISANRGRQTVKQVLSFSRQQEQTRTRMRLTETLREVLGLLRSSVPPTIEIEMQLGTDRDAVLACPAELHQVMMNLCTNAYHSMREHGGNMVVSLEEHQGLPIGWSLHPETQLNNMIRVSVMDEGTGITPDALPRIFEPFYTTKKQGDGTGLGLAIAHGILTRAGGMISVESQLGKGSTFHLYLPRLDSVEPAPGAPPEQPESSKEVLADLPIIRALVVDDETQIARLAKAVLSRYRMEVHTETDSVQACKLFLDDPYSFDVLITDQMMPGLKGSDLAQRALAARPDLPVILCTGYADSLAPEQATALGIREYILKPLDFGHLAKRIRKWFAEPTPACG